MGRGGPGELPYAPRRVGVTPRADLTVGARQSRGPLDGVVAVPRVEGVGAVLELPYEGNLFVRRALRLSPEELKLCIWL